MSRLKVEFDNGLVTVIELRDEGTPTVEALKKTIPFTADVNRWGDEVYFETPVSTSLEADARALMELGDVAYWPDGRALAMFFGRTPVSTDDRPRAYSPCNIVGTIAGDPTTLRSINSGATARVSVESQS
jgi:hypothetical protein